MKYDVWFLYFSLLLETLGFLFVLIMFTLISDVTILMSCGGIIILTQTNVFSTVLGCETGVNINTQIIIPVLECLQQLQFLKTRIFIA